MNQTTNYNLQKPEDIDFVDVNHQNSNMDIIDGQMKANHDLANGKLTNLSEDQTPELGGEMNAGENTIGFSEKDNGNSGTSKTIDLRLSNKQKLTLNGDCVLTLTAPSNPCSITLKLIQDATGNRVVTWPATVKWPGSVAPVLTTNANALDIISLYWDGVNYYGMAGLNFG